MLRAVSLVPIVREGGKIVVYQCNARLEFEGDTWRVSDIGDYTNWEAGEACYGRFPKPDGPILWATAFRDYVLATKEHAAYRGRYVGGACKWAWNVSVGELPAEWWPQSARWACGFCQATHPDGIERCTSCGAHRA